MLPKFLYFELNYSFFFIYNGILVLFLILLFIAYRSRFERRFQALIEMSQDAVALIDGKANIIYASPSTVRVLGYPPEEFIKFNGLDLVHPDDKIHAEKTLSELVREQGKSVTIEVRVRHKNGSWKWVESIGTNLLHKKSIQAIVVNYRDITQRKQIEEARSDFFWMAAHQLRTPLSNLKWNIELILSSSVDQLPQIAREKILKSQIGVQRMINQLNEILAISRMQQYQFSDQLKDIDVVLEIEKIINDLEPEINKKRITVNFNPGTNLPKVRAGEHHFYEIVQNLLSNAIKYNKDDGTVSIQVDRVDSKIKITISDSGLGIPEKDQAKIFTRFFRASNITDSEGTGLGLAIIKSYIDEMGGKVWFESQEGRGSTFYVELPYDTLFI